MASSSSAVEQGGRDGIGARGILEEAKGGDDHFAAAALPLDDQPGRLVHPADHHARMDPRLEVPGAAPGDDVVRDHAIEGMVDQRPAGDTRERPIAPQP